MVQLSQITNVKAGSKYIMYMYKTHQHFTPFTFIWKKKSFLLIFFVISQEESQDKLHIKPTSAYNSSHVFQPGTLCRAIVCVNILQKKGLELFCEVSFNSSELVTFFALLINIDQVLNDAENCMIKGKWVEEMMTQVKTDLLEEWDYSSRGCCSPFNNIY